MPKKQNALSPNQLFKSNSIVIIIVLLALAGIYFVYQSQAATDPALGKFYTGSNCDSPLGNRKKCPPPPTGLWAYCGILRWQGVPGAVKYNIYRDNISIGEAKHDSVRHKNGHDQSFNDRLPTADTNLPTHNYFVTAVSGGGGESRPSKTAQPRCELE